MEPVVAASHAILRPAAAAVQSDLSAVLRNGRVVVAEALPGSEGNSLLLAIGRHRVPANTDLRLEPGRPYLLRVVGDGAGQYLEWLDHRAPAAQGLLSALRASLRELRPLDELLHEAAARLRAGDGGGELSTPARERLQAWLDGIFLRSGEAGLGLREILARAGLGYEAKLSAATRSPWSEELAEELSADGKGLLLGALEEVQAGPLRTALAALVAGLEREQLLSLARFAGGEPLAFTLPFQAAGTTSVARLFLSTRTPRAAAERGPVHRLVLTLELPTLGSLRLDGLWRPTGLWVRVQAENPGTLALLESERPRLEELFRRPGGSLRLTLRRAPARDLRAEAHPFDVRFLERQNLVDLSG